MRIRKLNHSVYQAQYHITWITKYRRKWLKDYVKTELIKVFYRIQHRHPDWYFETINTDQDHVHIQIEFPPSIAPAAVVQELKAISAQHLRKKFKFLDRVYYNNSGLWGTGYFLSTVGLDEETIKRYIEMQGKEEVGVDMSSEFS